MHYCKAGEGERERERERERESFIRNNVHNGVVSGAARWQALVARPPSPLPPKNPIPF